MREIKSRQTNPILSRIWINENRIKTKWLEEFKHSNSESGLKPSKVSNKQIEKKGIVLERRPWCYCVYNLKTITGFPSIPNYTSKRGLEKTTITRLTH